jgi:hypothetical protein
MQEVMVRILITPVGLLLIPPQTEAAAGKQATGKTAVLVVEEALTAPEAVATRIVFLPLKVMMVATGSIIVQRAPEAVVADSVLLVPTVQAQAVEQAVPEVGL